MNFCVEALPLHHVRSYGKELANGSFDGFAGVLQRKEADIVATDFTITHEVMLYTYIILLTIPLYKIIFRGAKLWIFHILLN